MYGTLSPMIVPHKWSVVSYGYAIWAIYAFQQPWKQVAQA
jgi:hypothetical protein